MPTPAVPIKDIKALCMTLKDMGHQFLRGEHLRIRGYDGEDVYGQVIVYTSSAYDIGFQRRGDEYVVCANWVGVHQDTALREKPFRQRLNQGYSHALWQLEHSAGHADGLVAQKQWAELSKLGAGAVKLLISALNDPDSSAADRAHIEGLLAGYINNGPYDVNDPVASALSNAGDAQATEILINAAKKNSSVYKYIHRLRNQQALELLEIGLFDEGDRDLRQACADALAGMCRDKVVDRGSLSREVIQSIKSTPLACTACRGTGDIDAGLSEEQAYYAGNFTTCKECGGKGYVFPAMPE